MSCKDVLKLFSIVTLMVATPSIVRADPEPDNPDRRIVASKAYVDTKNIPAETAGQIATHSGTAGTFGTPLTKTSSIDDSVNTDDGYIPTVGAVEGYVQKTATIDASSAADNGYIPTVGAVEGYAEALANKSNSIATDTGSTTKYPSVDAVEDYAVAIAQGSGNQYKVLGTGSTGSVSPEYLKVPIANGAPGGTGVTVSNVAQVWLEQTN